MVRGRRSDPWHRLPVSYPRPMEVVMTLSANLRRILFASGFMVLGSLGTVGLTAAAGRGGPGGPAAHGPAGGPERVVLMAMRRLDLTDEQQALLDDAIDDIRDQVRAAHSGRERPDREALIAAVADGSLDREALHARVDARLAAMAETAHLSIDRIMDVYESLDADQKAELAELLTQAAERRGAMGRPGPGPGPAGAMPFDGPAE
ncbi:MAG: periplasmic heavy metal sensor [Deltaproteobacteria bacterium]|nr:MAG: periplasmic heavy metal sensor [Deltaproteobacteria bacterium]